MKTATLTPLLLLFSFFCNAQYSMKQDTTRGNIQGLYEIQQAAIKFITRWNQSHQTNYMAGEPNLKSLVCRCEVPLKTAWMNNSKRGKRLFVEVICDKSFCENGKKWSMPVPVIITKEKK
ncbi:MAG: hypothetical protein BGN96_05560 [Bacteroidales bacterium 45-6]|uniref:hypothetical protein n=1 Tax=uncultured Dysgonomonas sp. TaxID=206096 RepID=UPI000964AAE8|nr:hypothetical protein [uncultured Dysgonomonas sp.]OJU47947.1 MAG: hypothetical protein BGN96_05560 [Bacteroidales bacterium 45-6]